MDAMAEPDYLTPYGRQQRQHLEDQARARQVAALAEQEAALAMATRGDNGPDLITEVQMLRKLAHEQEKHIADLEARYSRQDERIARLEAMIQPQEISRALGGLMSPNKVR